MNNLGLGGYSIAYWKSDYANYGNRNQANAMRNMDLRNPDKILPGPARQRLTNGDESGVVGTLMLRIMPRAFASNETYGVGGKNIYKLTSTAITHDHTLNTAELGADAKLTDSCEYHDLLFYVCDRDTANKATVGMRDAALAYDDDFLERSTGSTTGTFSLTYNVPHKLLVGGDDILYITNGNKISSYDITTDIGTEEAIDLPADAVATDVEWNSDKIIITVDWPRLTGSNRTFQRIYIWNTVSESWDLDVPQVRKGGALYTKRALLLSFMRILPLTAAADWAILTAPELKRFASLTGTLPDFYQIDEKDGFICWVSTVGSEDLIFCWGAGDARLSPRVFQLMKGKFVNIGAIGLPFGSLLVASENGLAGGDNNRCDVSKEAGYDSDSYFYGMTFPISLDGKNAVIRKMIVNTDQIQAGAQTVLKLRNSAGTELFKSTLSYDRVGRKTKKIYAMVKRAEDARLEIDNRDGFSSTTTIVLIKKVILSGYSVK